MNATFLFLSLAGAQASVPSDTDVGARPPKGAIVLFDGSNASEWMHRKTGEDCKWKIVDGCLEVTPGTTDIVTKRSFGSYRLHLEFWLPKMPEAKDQARANSGVYNHGRYEVQILDSYENPTYPFGGCGAIYGQKDPDVNAIRPPESWNAYDITFIAPKLDASGQVVEKPKVTVYHNGKLIHRDVEIAKGATTAGLEGPQLATGPILLQNHGCAVRFRNIWIVELSR